jgi:uncharacterized caspase-like protein
MALAVSLGPLPLPAFAAGSVTRFVLAAGTNEGGADRARLRYAVADAERFAQVLVELGGVPSANAVVLKDASLRDFLQAIDQLSARVAEARRASAADGGRVEALVYYSGHADEKGLLLADDRYSYRTLRDRLDQVPADVRIAVLDACASGAFTRRKGGRARAPFLVDASSSMRGYAFLTPNTDTEVAQESDRIKASYFTHYLVSGLRGAADASGDGKVTLNEAYQFAFGETVGRTVQTRGGAQHPSYDIDLSGSGDVVITDVRQTTATLVLGAELEGRLFVLNASQQLVVELFKPRGRRVELGVEPGAYEIRIERDSTAMVTRAVVGDGGSVALDPSQFRGAPVEVTRRRGPELPPYAVAGRNRVALRVGTSTHGSDDAGGSVTSGTDTGGLIGGLQYTRYVREQLAVTFGPDMIASVTGSRIGGGTVFSGTASVIALPLGVRWNPSRGVLWRQSLKPFVGASIGPVIGSSTGSTVTASRVNSGASTHTTIGGVVGGGVDVHLGRSWSLGVDGGYQWMSKFPEPVGGRREYRGLQLGVGIGWLFGGR